GVTVQHRLSPAILRPARDVVADGNRAFFTVGNRLDSAGVHALAREEAPDRHGPACPESEIIFARATLIGVAFDGDPVLRILVEPARLVAQDALRLAGQRRAVHLEMNQIADIDGEISLRSGCCRPCAEAELFGRLLARTRGQHDSNCGHARYSAGIADPPTP